MSQADQIATEAPRAIGRHADEIARLLETAGWVSPGLPGPAVYVVAFRSCPDCIRIKAELLGDLRAAGLDTRLIHIARADIDGAAKSSPVERATAAELWLNRDWALQERWSTARIEDWTAEGIPPADGDAARTAAVEAGRALVAGLKPLLSDNGVDFRYPTLVWRGEDGGLMACVCEARATYDLVRVALGVKER